VKPAMLVPKRTHYCGDLRQEHINQEVTLMGWLFAKREYKKLVFVDLRDHRGIVQLVFSQKSVDLDLILELTLESNLWITGKVVLRKEENPDLPTGKIEVQIAKYGVFSKSEGKLPFALHEHIEVAEDLRLEYRYLDLRRPEVFLSVIKIRHETTKAFWEIMDQLGFYYVETPALIKSTPEGARDYLVPSRIHPGCFYALPQSPQILKQLLMVSGVDRYFQIARCFRDEDLRADRQPEFTQIDIEMSYINRDDILEVCEKIISYVIKKVRNIDVSIPFKRISYTECMEKYGSDKPDFRWSGHFESLVYKEKRWKAIGCETASSAIIDEITAKIGWKKEQYLIITCKELKREKTTESGEYFLLVEDNHVKNYCSDTHEQFRRELMHKLALLKPDHYELCWVVDFPLLEFSEEEKRLVSVHHPFTSPHPEDIAKLEKEPLEVRANAYDLVMNGFEIGGGSIRIFDQALQSKIFSLLGISATEQQERFGFLLKAFKYGPPPHGGIAFGLDRIVMLLANKSSLRDIIAFPKNKAAQCLLTQAPEKVDPEQLKILGIKTLS
jgi:aspartyl-tRNA synthetase